MRLLYKNTMISSLLIALSLMIVGSHLAQAQCTTVASCDTLGFDKDVSKCDTTKPILKCPSDTSKVFCVEKPRPAIGDIYYSDGTFSSDVVSGKTAIGVVFDTTNKLVVSLFTVQMHWNDGSSNLKDIQTLTNYKDAASALMDLDGKSNTNKIIEFQSSSGQMHQAAHYCANYITAGTNKGDWFLPSAGQLKQLYETKNYVNAGLVVLNIPVLNYGYYMSSSEESARGAWNILFQGDGSLNSISKNYNNPIYVSNYNYFRPVMQF